jgi:ribosomal protein S27AE
VTQRIDCGNCGFTLYWGESIRHRYIMRFSEKDVLAGYENRCPNCEAHLTMDSVKMDDRVLGAV